MRRTLLFCIKFAITIGLLYFAMSATNFAEILAKFRDISLTWVLLALAAAIAQICISAVRWQIVGRQTGIELNKNSFLRYSLVGMFFNQTLPSSIGGDAFRIWLVARATGASAAAAYSVFIDRTIGLLALVFTVLVYLPWSYTTIDDRHGRIFLLLVDFGTLFAASAFLSLGLLHRASFSRHPLLRHVIKCSVLTQQITFGRSTRSQIVLLSFAANAMVAAVAWALAKGIGSPVSYGTICQIIFPITLVTILPISIAGWGVRETTMSAAFVYAGLSAQDGVSISILFGLAWFVAGALGGLTWVLSGETLSKTPAPAHNNNARLS